VRGEEGLAMLLEVCLIGIEHAIEPRQKLLGAVIGVENDGNAIEGSEGADVVGSSNGTADAGSLAVVGDALAGKVSGTALTGLENDGALLVAGSLKSADNGGRRGDVDGGNGIVVILGVLEKLQDIVTGDTVCK
jgi:hypothetical protein